MNHKARDDDDSTMMGRSECPATVFATGSLVAAMIALLALGTLVAGCSRGSDEPSPNPAATNVSGNVSMGQPVAPAEVQPQTLDVPNDAAPDLVLDELNRELRRWLVRNKRRPASFEEFVSTAQIQVPVAPAGRKYTLSKETRIVLVDQ